MPAVNQNQANRIVLVPSTNQAQLDVKTWGGSTIIQQTALPVSAPSPAILTFRASVQQGNTCHIWVQMAAGDTVASVTDDAGGGRYVRLSAFTNLDGTSSEVWSSPLVATPPTGVVVTTTNSTPIVSAMLSECDGSQVTQ